MSNATLCPNCGSDKTRDWSYHRNRRKQMSELLPCPFCGEPAQRDKLPKHTLNPLIKLFSCSNHKCWLYRNWCGIEAWNRRPASQEPAQSAQPVEQEAGITLTLTEARNLAAMAEIMCDGQPDYEVLVRFAKSDEVMPDDDGNPSPAGLYMWDSEVPEEGCVPISSKPDAPPAAREPEQKEGVKSEPETGGG